MLLLLLLLLVLFVVDDKYIFHFPLPSFFLLHLTLFINPNGPVRPLHVVCSRKNNNFLCVSDFFLFIFPHLHERSTALSLSL